MLVPLICKADEAFMVGAVRFTVKVGLFNFAFKFKAVCVAVETGFAKSLVLSTLPSPTTSFVIPETVPVNSGSFIGALSLTDDLVA